MQFKNILLREYYTESVAVCIWFYTIIHSLTIKQDFLPSFIHSAAWLAARQQPLHKTIIHRAPSSVSSFSFHHPYVSLRSASSCLHLIRQLPVTYILNFVSCSVTCFWKQFKGRVWLMELSCFFLLSVGYTSFWLDVILCHFSMLIFILNKILLQSE